MNLKPKDKVVLSTGTHAVVIATHTYEDGTQIASVKTGELQAWVAVSELKKVS